MKYLRVFKTPTQYKNYCTGGDVWLPRVSYVVTDYLDTDGTTDINFNEPGDFKDVSQGRTWAQFLDSSVAWDKTIMERTKGYVDWRILHTEFMRVANGGVCYLTDTNRVVSPGTPSDDASAYLEFISYDASTDTSYMRLVISTKNATDSTVCYVENSTTTDASGNEFLVPQYVEKIHAYNADFE